MIIAFSESSSLSVQKLTVSSPISSDNGERTKGQ
jgi:hypothetical protein